MISEEVFKSLNKKYFMIKRKFKYMGSKSFFSSASEYNVESTSGKEQK
jgi:hypothetical protein